MVVGCSCSGCAASVFNAAPAKSLCCSSPVFRCCSLAAVLLLFDFVCVIVFVFVCYYLSALSLSGSGIRFGGVRASGFDSPRISLRPPSCLWGGRYPPAVVDILSLFDVTSCNMTTAKADTKMTHTKKAMHGGNEEHEYKNKRTRRRIRSRRRAMSYATMSQRAPTAVLIVAM